MVGLWVRTVAKGTNTVVLLSIGSFSSGEKMDPEETGTNICTLSDQIEEEVRLVTIITASGGPLRHPWPGASPGRGVTGSTLFFLLDFPGGRKVF